jgi:hypothetical protein
VLIAGILVLVGSVFGFTWKYKAQLDR